MLTHLWAGKPAAMKMDVRGYLGLPQNMNRGIAPSIPRKV